MTYDDTGIQRTLTDPNAGTTTYDYDAAGRITRQEDSRGKVTINKYDELGRLDTLIVDTTVTVYNYGKSGYELLQLVKKQTGDNYQEYTYDIYGHIASENRQIAGTGMLAFAYTYNALGQLSRVTYPGNLAINRQYDACGNLEKVSSDTQSIWELTGSSGTVTTARLGGTLTATETHNSQGLLTNLKTVKDSGVLHNMDFIFDGTTGNLTSRSGMLDQTESFTYDNLDRLTYVREGSTDVMQMGYATNGNISSKTGVGAYTYFESKPHAVVGVENTGNLISKSTQSTIFNEFGKIKSISDAGSGYRMDFIYGPDQERWKTVLKQNNISVKTSIFAGDYEQITKSGITTRLYYLHGGAIYVKQEGQDDKVYYTCADHLGSIVKLVDGNGTEVFKASYDAWGKQTIINNTFAFHRGYTGHEHLSEFDLINMNGRLYDPILGRFLSPDPFVQMPDLSQNFNRYSYCLNNPLKFIDPSGEFLWIPVIIGTIAGSYMGGVVANEGNFNPTKWDYSSGKTWGYMLGGAAIRAGSAYLGTAVATSGIPMANTAGIATASFTNSLGMNAMTGGQTPISIGFGVASYDFTNSTFGYLGKKGNKWYENLAYGFGALANASDLVSLFSGGGINADLIVEKKDAISHSALVNESEGINISVGPYNDFGEGINMTALKSGTGTFKELGRTMKGKVWENHALDGKGWKLPINNVSRKILSDMSSSIQTKMNNQTLMWNLLGKSCVGYTSRALWSVGIPSLGGIHPYWLQMQMITRQIGIYSSPYFY